MATAAVLCFFPVFVNTIRGLTSVRPAQVELMRSYAAGELEIFRRVRVPTALPFVFSALKVATVLAMIGAIVADYFGDLRLARESRSRTPSRCSTSRRPGRRSSPPASSASRCTSRVAHRTLRPPVGSNASGKGHCMKREVAARICARSRRRRRARRGARDEPGTGSTEAHPRHAAAEVGDAGPVRRLLRGRRKGLLQEGRPRRHAQGRRPGHHSRAGRARRPGRLRPRLAAEPLRDA